MTTLLCPANRCRARGQHRADCTGCDCRNTHDGQHRTGHQECGGCLPRQLADGWYVCRWHGECIGPDALALAELHDELTLALVRSGARVLDPNGGGGGSGDGKGIEVGISLSDKVVQARHEIRNLLASWAKLIVEERGFSLPDGDNMSLARLISENAGWLAGQDFAGDAADELSAQRGAARLLQPNSRHSFTIGPCPHDGCGGTIIGSMRPTDVMLPPSVRCDTDPEHRWASNEWHRLRTERISA